MSDKYLDEKGLERLWGNFKESFPHRTISELKLNTITNDVGYFIINSVNYDSSDNIELINLSLAIGKDLSSYDYLGKEGIHIYITNNKEDFSFTINSKETSSFNVNVPNIALGSQASLYNTRDFSISFNPKTTLHTIVRIVNSSPVLDIIDIQTDIDPGNKGISSGIKQFTIRPDAELVESYTYDDVLAPPGYYSTNEITLKDSESISFTNLDSRNYYYLITHRCLTIPEYNTDVIAPGRQEYHVAAGVLETVQSKDHIKAIIDPSIHYSESYPSLYSSYLSYSKYIYFNNNTLLRVVENAGSGSSYGGYQSIVYQNSIAYNYITTKTPRCSIRGHDTYFNQTYMEALTGIRYQYIIELYQVPASNILYDGWLMNQELNHTIACATSDTHTLT